MTTRIYISAKIQKNYKKIVLNPLPDVANMQEHINSWNANYIPFLGKKCWLLTHTITRYTVIVPDITVKDLDQLLFLFQECIIQQLVQKHLINADRVLDLVGQIEFYPTNNDKSSIGYNNQRIQDLSYWKTTFHSFEEVSFSRLGANLNIIGTRLNHGKSQYIYPTEEFLSLINKPNAKF